MKLCECGCGEAVGNAPYTHRKIGWVKGQPKRFIQGHHMRLPENRAARSRAMTERLTGAFGVAHPAWRGGRAEGDGYVWITVGREHPMADSNGRVKEHRLVMAKALGRWLDPEEVVHHINGCKDDNHLENLELFANRAEHTAHHWQLRQVGQLG